jgi:hypothetical protein
MANTTSSDPPSNSLRFGFEDGENLLDELNSGDGVSPELSRNMTSEIAQILRQPEDILVVGTDGFQMITIVMAPHAVVQGTGPVLISTFDKDRIVAMVSREFIEAKAHICDTADDQDAAQEEWDALLGQLFESALELGNHNSRELLNIVEFLQ